MPDSMIIVPQATQTDPVGKYRVSTPQSLIDTDFEYGQQSAKWEQLDLENNRQSAYYFTNQPIAGLGNIGSTGTTQLVIQTTANPGNGVPIFIEEAIDTNANGWWLTSNSNSTTITINTTTACAPGNLNNQTATYVYQGYFYSNAGITVNSANTTAITANATALTVNTVSPHGLSANSYVYITNIGNSNTTATVNGAWVVSSIPNTTAFVINTTLANGTITTGGAQNTVYARPSGYVETRAYNGSVNFTAGASVPNQQMIRQTRRYFRYQSGKGIQFSTGSSLKPKLLVNSIVSTGSLVTVRTFSPHNLTNGTFIQISGATDPAYNGIVQIFNISANGFNYNTVGSAIPVTSPAVTSTGVVPQISPYSWYGASNRIGYFDQQHGMFFQFDGQTLSAVYRNSVNQLSGNATVIQGNAVVTSVGSTFTKQLNVGDYIVIRGQSHRVTQVQSDTQLTINPEYRGANIARALISKTVDQVIPQSQWNLDPVNGTGPSGYTLDLTKVQMWYIDFSWYGAGTIRWGMRTNNGVITYCHSLPANNIQPGAYLRSGNLPSRYESTGQGAITGLYSNVTSVQTTLPIVSASGFNPAGGTVKITAPTIGGNVEYATYTNIITGASAGLPYDQLTGVTRGTSLGGVATAFTAVYPYSASFPQVSVEYSPPDAVAVISHWGSSVVMDGGFNNDFSSIFNYGTTANVAVGASGVIPILAIRVAPSVDNGTVGTLGNKEIINRLTLQLRELGVLTSSSFLIQLVLNGIPTGFNGTFASPTQGGTFTSSICQVAANTNVSATITGGESIGAAFTNSTGQTTLDLTAIAGIGNAILGGGTTNTPPNITNAGQFPDGPDILYVVATNVSGASANIVARLSWTESQA
jgi:hypothetical protein